MNNFRLLNIVNPQFIYALDCGQEQNNNKYMVVIPALLGYEMNVACAIYLTISDKLMDESTNNGLERLINDMQEDLTILLRGYDDYVPGVDYFLSESLYNYIKTADDDSSDSPIIPPEPIDPGEPTYCMDLSGIVIMMGEDVNRIININRYNIKRVSEILALEEFEKRRRRKVLTMMRPDITDYLTDDDLNEIDEDLSVRLVMNDYVLYDTSLNFTQNTVAYKYLFDINNKDMRNLEWFLKMNNLNTHEYTIDELCNIPRTFFSIILNNAVVQNPETLNNQIYDRVVRYFANGSWDDATVGLNLLLNSTVSTTLTNTRLNCGCQGSGKDGVHTGDPTQTMDCIELYKAAILEWLKKMLGDPDFYKDWFFTLVTGACPDPNKEMIDALIRLLQEYVDRGLGKIGDPSDRYNIWDHMGCCKGSTSINPYLDIINNYIKVLKAVRENMIDENKNFIHVNGEAFADILLKLTC